ncbi:MAG: hypothetical protein H0T47_01070 [Planctomycetaceae bacterium]|nr:hypothetical protein [Planctomycetaceae bacterium]
MARRIVKALSDLLAVLAFVVGISTPGVVMLTRAETPEATTENRALAAQPTWSWDWNAASDYPAAFEKFFDDAFGFRATLTRWHHLANFHAFGISPTSTVVVGKDGWLFLDYSMKMYRRETRCTEPELRLQTRLLQERHDWLAAQGIKYLVVLVPNKPEVYPQFVPTATYQPTPESYSDRLEAYAKSHGSFEVLNLRPALIEASKDTATFGASDCHWNAFGGYVGYREIINRLAGLVPGLAPPLTPQQCVMETRPATGDLMHIMGFPELMEPRIFMKPANPRSRGLEQWRGIRGWSVVTNVDDDRLPKAVILHDSFMTAPSPFLAEHFQTANFRWIYTDFDTVAIAELKPDVVIQELVERSVHELHRNPPELAVPNSGPVIVHPPLAAGPAASNRK